MAAIAIKTIRQRVAAAIAGVSGWNLSRFAYDLVGSDPGSLMHQSFAVRVSDTTPAGGRQVASEGAYCSSTVSVRLIQKMVPVNDPSAAEDAATDGEAAVIVAVQGVSRADLHLRYGGTSNRALLGSEFIQIDFSFLAHHHLALE